MSNATIEANIKIGSKIGNMGAFDAVARRVDQVSKRLKVYNATANALAATARFVAPAAIAYGAAASVKRFAEVERGLTRTGLKLGANREEMNKLGKTADMVASKYALSLDGIRETIDAYAETGATISDVTKDIDVLAKAQQALGANGSDIVNTWDAARRSMGLTSQQAEKFFGVIGAGGAAGKFEASDMARYMPSLMPIAARNGYDGMQGAEKLVAMLEVMRNFVGTSEEAAASVSDFLEKATSPDVEKRLKKMGIDSRKEFELGTQQGKDFVQIWNQILTKATGGDARNLSKIFGDKEARRAAGVIMDAADEIQAAQDAIAKNAPSVLDENTTKLLNDTQAKLDKMSQSWDKFKRNIGGGIAYGVTPFLDQKNDQMDRAGAVFQSLYDRGYSGPGATAHLLTLNAREEADLAWRGGYRSEDEKRMIAKYAEYGVDRTDPASGRQRFSIVNGLPVPSGGGDVTIRRSEFTGDPNRLQKPGFDALETDRILSGIEDSGAQAGQNLGQTAGELLQSLAEPIGAAIGRAARAEIERASLAWPDRTKGGQSDVRPMPGGRINADTGRSGGDIVSREKY